MTAVNESLLMQVADALQIQLHPDRGHYRGRVARPIRLGPWLMVCDVKVMSDELSKDVVSFFVNLRKDLWLYVVSWGTGPDLVAHVVNGSLCGLTSGTFNAYGTGDRGKTMEKMKKGMSVMYKYSKTDEAWHLQGGEAKAA